MDPRTKMLRFKLTVAFLILSIAPSLAAVDPIFASIQHGATDDALLQMGMNRHAMNCHRPACQSIIDLNELEDELLHRDRPNGPALKNPSKFDPHVFDRRVDRILKQTESRHAALCGTLAVLLSHYVDVDGTQKGAWELELASRIDALDRPGCLAQAVAAVPEGQAGDTLFENMRFECDNHELTGLGQDRSCTRFSRPSPAVP